MKVYVVMRIIPYEGAMLRQVFKDELEAIAACEEYNNAHRGNEFDEYLKYFEREVL